MRTALDEDLAADLAWRHGLRGMDAVQLATACSLQAAVGADGLAFAAFDDQLNRAATAEGLIVLEPSSQGG
jgi:predicted nucleic acid-binding protein